jgi:hypothetical protein
MNHERINHAVEIICQLGCARVNMIIGQIERGEKISELDGLDCKECETLLHELKAIMSVYQRPCKL